MSKQTINIGASPNDGTGTPLRTSFDYTNQNFTEIYTALGGGVALPGATTQVIFNDGGTNLAGDAGLVYNKTTDALTVAGLVTAGSATITGAATVGTTLGVTGDLTASSDVLVNGNEKYVYLSSTYSIGSNPRVRFRAVGAGGGSGYGGDFRVSTRASNNSWNTDALIVDSSANVGIGAAATSKLTVNGEISIPDNFALRLGSNQAGGATLLYNGDGNLDITPRSGFHTKLINGNLIIGTSGKGIDFGATSSPSAPSIMTSELLNDYEEGTWVPTDLSGAGLVFTVANCKYTKIGRAVTVQGKITYPVTVSAADAIITGFPFSAADAIFLSIAYTDTSIAAVTYMDCNSTAAYLKTPTANTPNSAMSGKNISFLGTYYV